MPYQNTSAPVDIANAIYLMQGYTIQPNYKSIGTQKFYSKIQSINFANRARAANTINSWVSQKTHGKIENLISPDALNGLTRLVLVNAIYFKGNWVHRFTYTNDGPFYPNGCNDASAITTKMMHVTVSAKIIDIPSQFIIKICSLNLYF